MPRWSKPSLTAWPSGVNGIAAVVVKHQRIKENRGVVDERLGGIMTGYLDGSLVEDGVVGPEGRTAAVNKHHE